MSDSNRTGLYFVEETTWGTTPASALQALRMPGESFDYTVDTVKSNEIRDDRNSTDLIITGFTASGGFDFETSYGTFDSLLEGALQSDWTSGDGTGYTVNDVAGYVAGDTTIAVDTGTGSVEVGDVVTFVGDDNYYTVETGIAAPGDVVLAAPGLKASLADGVAMTVVKDLLRNGVTEKSYTIERSHADINQFFQFTGMEVDTFSMTASAGTILTGSFGFQGKDCTVAGTTCGTGAATAATTTDVLNAMNNVGEIKENDVALTSIFIQELSFNVANNLRAIKAIGVTGSADMKAGAFDVSGSMNTYFANTDLYAKFIAGTATSLSFKVSDAAGNYYTFTFPKVKFSSDKINAGSSNSDVMENLGWTAVYDATTNCTMHIVRHSA